jgi:hypothetical protein
VPGHLHSWWPCIFFVVFKTPSVGQMHIFKKNEPYAQLLIIPKKNDYEIKEMSEEEKAKRSAMETTISDFRLNIASNVWKDYKGNEFDDKYKKLFNTNGKLNIKSVKKSKLIGKFIKKTK